ncbi:MAG: pyridoxal 5'-phosphate synthase glutaminase subunit PdxT [Actinomycetota bacterium]|nr:pyridoxal 5'-phosphate synthase glutaminase subunit PdxT [Actinomycetota bacterium]
MSGAPRVGVLALQGDVREHAAVLDGLGAEVVPVRRPDQLAAVDALVLPGGESTTLTLLLASSGLAGPLAERLAGGMPALGTCAGMILLGGEVVDGRPGQRGLGAIDVAVRRNAFGRQIASFEADLQVTGVDGPMHAVFIRAPVVEKAGDLVEVLATVRLGDEDRPVVCRQGNVVVASFHPELSGDGRLHALALAPLLG